MITPQRALSVMTFNVHMWRTIDGTAPNVERVRQVLERWSPNIVVLNEVTQWPDSTRVLPGTHGHAAFKPLAGCNNAIASDRAPTEQWVERIDDERSFAGFGFETYCVFATHLDVSRERVRCRQLEHLHERVQDLAGQRPYLLVGDFNALRRDDYRDEEWRRLADIRADSGREEPLHAAVDFMLARGYVDAAREAGRGSRGQAARQANGLPPWPERQTGLWTPHATCWAGTRIDYVWMSPRWRWPTLSCHVVEEYCSDHFPVLVEFG